MEAAWRGYAAKGGGGLRLPGDERRGLLPLHPALADEARRLGVTFVFNCPIDEVGSPRTPWRSRAGEQRFQADAIVCALAAGTGFLRPSG